MARALRTRATYFIRRVRLGQPESEGAGHQEGFLPGQQGNNGPSLRHSQRRASACGLFTAGHGIFWFAGSAILGLLYSAALPALIGFSVLCELAAIPLFLLVRRRIRAARTA